MSSVSNIYQQLLKSLNLGHYPCKKQELNDKIIKFPNGKKFLIKEDDENLVQEREEMLYLMRDKKSPWYTEYEWSNEAQQIRELFINNPKSIDFKNIEQYFKTLRLINKNIHKIDEGLLKFYNLNELILSVNWIESCDSAYLPNSLKILDLSANQLSDLSSFEHKPLVNLQHLGLAYNHLSDLSDSLNAKNWSNLLGLDLSGNHLVNLKDLVMNKLRLLPKLKNLVLYANPLCLIPSYRGFIIDSLSELNFFDDQSISKDERFRYFNMRLHPGKVLRFLERASISACLLINKDFIKNEAQIIISVTNLANVYMPYEIKYPESLPEYPINIFKYFVRLYFVEDVEFEQEKSVPHLITPDPYEEVTFDDYKILMKDRFTHQKSYKTRVVETQHVDYHENINFTDKGLLKFTHKSLKALRDFMLHGMKIEVIEKKTCYDQPKVNSNELASSTLSKDKKKDAAALAVGAKKESSAIGNKNAKDTNKKTPGGDPKKKKDMSSLLANLELIKSEERIVSSFHMDLASILDCNKFKIESKFNQELEIPEYVVNEFNEQNYPKTKDKKGGGAGGNSDAKKDVRKSAKVTNDTKTKRKGSESKHDLGAQDGEPILVAQTLELNMTFEILNFSSADQFFSHFNVK